MDNWKSLIVVLAIVALFSYALLNYGYITQVNNNLNTTILSGDSPLKSFNSSLGSNLNSLDTSSKTYKGQMENESSTEVNYQGAITLGTIYHSITTFSGFIYGFVQSTNPLLAYLGISPIVFTILMALLIVIVILLFWRLYKIGT